MPTELRCTQCGRTLQAGDASPGTRILCPGCGAFSTVPAPDPVGTVEFRCPGCNKLLRTASDAAGKQAKCPECGMVTTIPAPPGGPGAPADVPGAGVPDETLPYPSAPPSPSRQPASPFAAGGPGPAPAGDAENPYLAPTQYGEPPQRPFAAADPMAASRVAGPAIALIVTGALGLAANLFALVVNLIQLGGGMAVRPGDDVPIFLSGGVGVFSAGVGVVLSIVVITGAVKMKNLESHGFAMAAAIIALVPCISPCCFLGLPFGIWALVVLSDAHVKAAFRG